MQTPFNKDIQVLGTLLVSDMHYLIYAPGHSMREAFIFAQFTDVETETDRVTGPGQVARLGFHSSPSDSKVCALNYRASTSANQNIN